MWDPRQRWFTGPGDVKQAIFRAPFLAPSSEEVSRVNPEEGCSVTQGAVGLHCCFGPVENNPIAWAACVRVHGTTAPSVPTPAASPLAHRHRTWELRVYWSHDLRLTWIKVRGSCADHQPHSLIPVHLSPEARHSRDGWRWVGMQWMASYVSHCALGALHNALLGPPSCRLSHFGFVRTVRRI